MRRLRSLRTPVILNTIDMSSLSPQAFSRPIDASLLDQIAIVLMEPKFPENIGAAARIAWNMGLSRLIVVRKDKPDYESMAKMATHKAVHLIDTMELHENLEKALAPFSCVVGTTARRGRQRLLENSPRDIIQEIAPLLPDNQIAFLFGPENCGLTNDDLKYCQMTSAIPTAGFSSLNLAQAVAVHCYEIHYGLIHAKKDMTPSPRLASLFELEGMYAHLEEALLKIDFLQEKNHAFWMNNIRHFLSRIRLSPKDANIIRGICRQFLWYQSSIEKTNHEGNST
jgi:tRNA/rRNA methyltransferase